MWTSQFRAMKRSPMVHGFYYDGEGFGNLVNYMLLIGYEYYDTDIKNAKSRIHNRRFKNKFTGDIVAIPNKSYILKHDDMLEILNENEFKERYVEL